MGFTKATNHTQHLRHRTLLRTHAKSELHILDQMELDELICFASRQCINIKEEKKLGHEAILNKVLNDPKIIELRRGANLC